MLMSKSRLEKFLYSLYSLDSSDLPTPLSRIEELYKCWVTGEEAPTFKPLSRVEKYLMAILGAYDVDSLPNPLSRVEVLLYKLATGDDNLDDVKSFLSEHEELLAEIIRNGGVGGNIDIEYVLYTLSTESNTLYNTAEKPIKSAILKGQTLVNVNRSNYITNTNVTTDYGQAIEFYDADMLPNTTYTIITYSDNPYECRFSQMYNDREYALSVIKVGTPFVFTTVGNYQGLRSYLKGDELNIPQGTEIKILIIEGDYTNIDIPYFEGMQSVKMPVLTTVGKNLIDLYINPENCPCEIVDRNTVVIQGHNSYTRYNIPVFLEINKTYTLTGKSNAGNIRIRTNSDGSGDVLCSSGETFTMNKESGIYYLSLNTLDYNGEVTFSNIQLEEGSVATEYEPYKSNILTVNEDVELRGIGDVKDELDLTTGEVVNKFGEIILNGDENWRLYGSQPNQVNTIAFKFSLTNHASSWSTGLGYCDRLSFTNGAVMYVQDLECVTTDANDLIIRVSLSKASSVDEFKAWLSNDNIRVVYPFKEEVIKTVDLSVVDQDGNNTKLSTFNDLTHVTLSSEGLIPEAELEVAIKNEEVLNTLSLEMDDISITQTTLEETSNAQSENVDATMIATTEIYEGLL